MAPAAATGDDVTALPHRQDEDQREYRRQHRQHQHAADDPDADADHRRGQPRAEQPAKHASQDTAAEDRNQQPEHDQRFDVDAVAARRAALGGRQRFARQFRFYGSHRRKDSADQVTAAKRRRHALLDDALGDRVGYRTFEAAADLDPHAPVVEGDQDQHAVVHAAAPDLPLVDDPNRIGLDRLRAGRAHDQHRDLTAVFRFDLVQPLQQPFAPVGRQRAGKVLQRRIGRRNRLQLLGRQRQAARQQPQPQEAAGEIAQGVSAQAGCRTPRWAAH